MVKNSLIVRAVIFELLELAPAKDWVKENRSLVNIILQILLILLTLWLEEWAGIDIPEVLRTILELP